MPRTTRRRILGLWLAALGGISWIGLLPGAVAAQDDPPAEAPTEPEGEGTARDEAPTAGGGAPSLPTEPWGVQPSHLSIPALGVEANVAPVNYDKDGLMDVPPDPDLVAWFEYGPGMGVGGNAIFAAHVDWGGVPRVFARLNALETGDAVLIVDQRGRGFQYVVQSNRTYDANSAPVAEIFGQTVEPIITLITCGGRYQAATREYLDRIVVVATGA